MWLHDVWLRRSTYAVIIIGMMSLIANIATSLFVLHDSKPVWTSVLGLLMGVIVLWMIRKAARRPLDPRLVISRPKLYLCVFWGVALGAAVGTWWMLPSLRAAQAASSVLR